MMIKINNILKLGNIALTLFMLTGLNTAHAYPFDGKEYAKLTAFAGITYNELDANCDSTTNSCRGITTGGFDLAGFTWATWNEATELMESFSDSGTVDFIFANTVNGFYTDDEVDDIGVALGFTIPGNNPNGSWSYGLVAEPLEGNQNDQARYVGVDSRQGWNGTSSLPVITSNARYGAFLYKSTSVPEPSALALIGLGLLGLFGIRRRKGQS